MRGNLGGDDEDEGVGKNGENDEIFSGGEINSRGGDISGGGGGGGMENTTEKK